VEEPLGAGLVERYLVEVEAVEVEQDCCCPEAVVEGQEHSGMVRVEAD